jgi:uncharacterized protein DUF4150
MAETISINGLSLSHKGSNGFSVATLPDVCKTPSPGGPIPIPYPNVSKSDSLSKGTKTIKVDGGNMAAIKGSEYSSSNGDEPGTAGGVKSSTNMKESTWITYSFDVKMDGKNACRLSDKKFQNHKNTVDLAGDVEISLLDSQMKLLCIIFCQCLQTRDFAKMGTNVGIDRSVFEDPQSIEAKTNRFENQKCVEKELEGNPTMIAEQKYDMTTKPAPSPITERIKGHRRPDVVLLAKPGAARGTNITKIVEMKFPGDSPGKGQYAAYRRIANENNEDATLEEMNKKTCNC